MAAEAAAKEAAEEASQEKSTEPAESTAEASTAKATTGVRLQRKHAVESLLAMNLQDHQQGCIRCSSWL
eukprot:4104233-Amphidinium_carterae.2